MRSKYGLSYSITIFLHSRNSDFFRKELRVIISLSRNNSLLKHLVLHWPFPYIPRYILLSGRPLHVADSVEPAGLTAAQTQQMGPCRSPWKGTKHMAVHEHRAHSTLTESCQACGHPLPKEQTVPYSREE